MGRCQKYHRGADLRKSKRRFHHTIGDSGSGIGQQNTFKGFVYVVNAEKRDGACGAKGERLQKISELRSQRRRRESGSFFFEATLSALTILIRAAPGVDTG